MLMPATYFCRYIISDKEILASIQIKRFMLGTLALKFEIFSFLKIVLHKKRWFFSLRNCIISFLTHFKLKISRYMNFSSINSIYSEHVFLNLEFVENIVIGERKIQNSTLIKTFIFPLTHFTQNLTIRRICQKVNYPRQLINSVHD